MKTVMLSIDFDFFSREDCDWDWGHDETATEIFSSTIWPLRYSQIDLYEETAQRHAGLRSWRLVDWLKKNGFIWRTREIHTRGGLIFAVADSHKHAYEWYLRRPADFIINIDAHHDLYSTSKERDLHCGNWVGHALLHRRAPKVAVTLYPAWRREIIDPEPEPEWNAVSFIYDEFGQWVYAGEPLVVTSVFLCRSPVWLPPHHDEDFLALVREISERMEVNPELVGGDLELRPYPTREEAAALRAQYQHQREELNRTFEELRQRGIR